ncbi:MAG: LacI family DNA-binding transcriptional regulator [Pygmaiobacter massiliensis]|nr:LacI family DNA-binding transcriptional regulator [Pygmaiobacter massiliensis]
MGQRPTIKTIAQLAGVSHVAVSKALRGATDISPETTAKIVRIADELGYTPNAAARSLSSARASSIGMIVPSLGENTAYNAVFNEISAKAAQSGFCVLLGSCHRSVELEEKHCRMMVENRVGALIVASCTSDVSHIKSVCRDNVPVIFLGGKTGFSETYSIRTDYRHSAHLAVEHLYSLGHRRIAFFAYSPQNNTIAEKETGYIEAMEQHSLLPRIYKAGRARDTVAAGKQLVQQLVQAGELPTAIWCASDLMAVGVLNALRAYQLRVPQDISVMGHDDLYFDILPNIGLTTLHNPLSEIGVSAAQMAIEILQKEQIKKPHQSFTATLVARETTDVVRKNADQPLLVAYQSGKED